MATPASLEASEIRRRGRRRLIGAVAIVLLLVVFVPMLLDSEPRPARNEPALDIPSKENAPPLPPPAPAVAETAHAGQGAAAKDAKASSAPAPVAASPSSSSAPGGTGAGAAPSSGSAKGTAAPQPTVAQVAPVAKRESPAAAPAAATASAKAPAKLEGFAVQVGAFRDAAKLREARDKLTAAGVPHYTERLEGASRGLTRLRAGPFPTREAAEAAMHRGSLKGKVIPLHGEH